MSPHESLLTWAQSATDGYTMEFHPSDGTDRPMIFTEWCVRLPPSLPQTNQAAEVTAIKAAAEKNNEVPNLYIESDSKYAINALTKNLTKHEDQGYLGLANAEILRATAATLRIRKGRTMFKWIKGHSGHKRNDGADRMANLGAQKDHPDEIDLVVQPHCRITGAKLSKLTQSLAYKGI
jgi:ribonuclease HI